MNQQSDNTIFSVDGIKGVQNDMAQRQMQEQEAQKMARQANKGADQLMKKLAQEKEKYLKMEEQKLHRLLFMKVTRRFAAFPFLREKIPALSNKPSLVELQETDDLQKLELDLQGSERRLLGMISQGGFLVEGLWGDGTKLPEWVPAHLKLNLKGFGKVVNSRQFMEEAAPLIQETIIEYPWLCQMGLVTRWLQCVFGAMLMVHTMNTNPELMKLAEKAKSMAEMPGLSEEDEDEDDDDDTKQAR